MGLLYLFRLALGEADLVLQVPDASVAQLHLAEQRLLHLPHLGFVPEAPLALFPGEAKRWGPGSWGPRPWRGSQAAAQPGKRRLT